jgi:hypothetical protein
VIALAIQIYSGDYQVSKHVLFAGWLAASNWHVQGVSFWQQCHLCYEVSISWHFKGL